MCEVAYQVLPHTYVLYNYTLYKIYNDQPHPTKPAIKQNLPGYRSKGTPRALFFWVRIEVQKISAKQADPKELLVEYFLW
jgi:hypothetical protein